MHGMPCTFYDLTHQKKKKKRNGFDKSTASQAVMPVAGAGLESVLASSRIGAARSITHDARTVVRSGRPTPFFV